MGFKFVPGLKYVSDWDGIICEISTFRKDDILIVKISSDDGIVGFGQAGNKDVEITEYLIHNRVAPALIHKKIKNPFLLYEKMLSYLRSIFSTLMLIRAPGPMVLNFLHSIF